MKLKCLPSFIALTSFFFIFSSCKKDQGEETKDQSQEEMAIQADDQFQASYELNATIIDITQVLEDFASQDGGTGDNAILESTICDAEITANFESDPVNITIHYNSANCSVGRIRTGKVVLSMPKEASWATAGAALTVEYKNLTIIRTKDQKSVVINGTKTYTNVSGGLLLQLVSYPPVQTIEHKVVSNNLTVRFGDNSAREWNIARQYTFSFNLSDGLKSEITGLHTEGDISGIADWGMSRFGIAFNTLIKEPVILTSTCSGRITKGVIEYITPLFDMTLKFGLNAQGDPVACPGEGNNYYYKVEGVTKNDQTFNALLPY